ncbi:MAG: XRE family transcriptional regulator [Bacteroidetes bacterium]|nr:MAG: XRE family transcriptional regulator [Bacteroidota bacterium]
MKMKIGNRLLAIRQEKGLTQVDIADLLGLPESTYARYERNETQIDYTKLVKFSEKLNVPVQDLLPETVSINNNNHNSGQGGGMIFGNQYFYLGDSALNSAFAQENKELKEKISILEQKIEELIENMKNK